MSMNDNMESNFNYLVEKIKQKQTIKLLTIENTF